MSRRSKTGWVIGGAIVAYFIAYPEDLAGVERILQLTQAVAPGAYALLITPIVVAGAVRIWGRRNAETAAGPT
jgi:hypothetical protein